MRRILIDAKWYYEGPASGRVVVRNIINSISLSNRINIDLLLRSQDKSQAEFDSNIDGYGKVYIYSFNSLIDNTITLSFLLLVSKRYSAIFMQNFVPAYKDKSVKYISQIHDVLFLDFPQFYSYMERLYFYPLKYNSYNIDTIVTVSETEKLRIETYYKHNNIVAIHHGVDTIFQYSRQQYSERSGVLFVGRINVRKNVDVLINIWKRSNMTMPLRIIGDYNWKTVKYDFNELLKYNIVFLGPKNQNEIYEEMCKSRVFVFPSLAESFGLPIAESMRSGLPVVAFNNTAIVEVVGIGYPLVESNNVESYTDMIIKLYNEEEYWCNVSEIGLENSKKYNWVTASNAIHSLINSGNGSN